ncbi:hypothetical protein KRX19_02330 [Cardiobacteriaceae bacterium TAE3-ERU3]|nr:hypothetical protein [Cardiobacteriaceae bacterium TAE3-ERU3]
MSSNLVNSDWLVANLDNPNLIVLDASMDSIQGDNSATEYYIPKAQIFDIEHDFSDSDSDLPHTIPNTAQFTAGMRKLGIKQNSTIVIYDSKGIYSSPRA